MVILNHSFQIQRTILLSFVIYNSWVQCDVSLTFNSFENCYVVIVIVYIGQWSKVRSLDREQFQNGSGADYHTDGK